MSAYDDKDTSVDEGAPIECYKLIGELKTYRYTSNNEEVTVAGELYEPLPGLTRTAIETTSLLDALQTVDIIVPINSEIAVTYNFLKMPITLTVEIRSVHRGTNFATDSKLIWQGDSVGFPVQETEARISTQSIIQSALNKQLNQVLFSTACNHEVYDEMCSLDPADFTTTSTVTNIKGNLITVVSTGVSNHELKIGKLVNQRTGENRVIIDNVGPIVTVGYDFIDIKIGDTVDMIIGCDNTYPTCLNTFNNIINNGGYGFLPFTNPYQNPV